MDNRELIVAESSNLPGPVVSMQQWAERRKAFNDWVNSQLHGGVDFGKVPGTDKPTLLKPGAEKIAQFYGCAVLLEAIERERDMQTGFFYIEYLAKLVSIQTGQIVATGVGACSSYESKYRWRWENWKDKKNAPPADSGWEQANGKYGTYYRRRIENRDLIDTWNTVIKMAKKRALVDACLTVSGASEKFTQDVEDFEPQAPAEPKTEAEPAPRVIARAEVEPPPVEQAALHWTKSKAEREAFEDWRSEHVLTDGDCKRLAGAALGRAPLQLFREFPGSREELQTAIERELEAQAARARAAQP